MNKGAKEQKINLSAIIIAKDEEERIEGCIDSVSFTDEIIVIDAGSTDKTVAIATEKGAKVYHFPMQDYATQRNHGRDKAKGEWLLYIDADERVSEKLKNEIQKVTNYPTAPRRHVGSTLGAGELRITHYAAYKIPRQNYYLGNYKWPKIEYLERLFLREKLIKWEGEVHEHAVYEGEVGTLKHPIIHYTHRDLSAMTNKTVEWSEAESDLLLQSKHPRMVPWRFMRIMGTKFINSYVVQGGWKAGTAGLIESMYQAYSYLVIYARLWEKQTQKIK